MKTPQINSKSTSEQGVQLSFSLESSPELKERLVLSSIDSGRVQSRQRLENIHPANRFRLMFGLPLLKSESER